MLSTLWLDCGPEFIKQQHDALRADIDRLQTAAASPGRRVLDLRDRMQERPVTDDLRCHRHMQTPAQARCADCQLVFCADCTVRIGDDRRAVCQDCALIAAGIRTANHRPQ